MNVEVSVLSAIQPVAEKFVWALIAEVLDLEKRRIMLALLLVFLTVVLTGKSAAEQLVGVLAVVVYLECEAVLAGVSPSAGTSFLGLLVVVLGAVLEDGGKCEPGPSLQRVFGMAGGCLSLTEAEMLNFPALGL